MFKVVRSVMTPEEVIDAVPLTAAQKKIKQERDEAIKKIFTGEDHRFLLIIGPCSADNEDAVCDYAGRLAKVAEKVSKQFMIVPRVYTNKPRTRGEGYKGMLHTPDPHKGSTDIRAGLLHLRHMHVRVFAESGLTAADEMLYPDNYAYLADVLSYVAVGARSAENQQHRLVASGVDVPVGIKNPMNGSLSVLMNSIYAAQIGNEFQYRMNQVKTEGNPLAHAVLRGRVDIFGNHHPNYHYEELMTMVALYKAQKLKNPAVIVDTNHSNSGKNPFEQVRIAKEVMTCRKANPAIASIVKGFLTESYIEDGNQSPDNGIYGKS
ncbi:MAG: 3-deoxy-7-phosphoheptulonate synthase, partial [Clostridiales bacterium]|nr:3-deoxy-7-phosphoheptulonate synthase [Clostridiales bacterium]